MRVALDPSADPAWYGFAHRVRVRFAETDAMGVVHHAAYLPYLEEARIAFLASHGHAYVEIREGGVDIAVIEQWMRYLHPARFGDEIVVHVRLGAPRRTSFQIAYLLQDADEAVATAVTVHACLDAATGRPLRLPAWLGALAAEGEEARA